MPTKWKVIIISVVVIFVLGMVYVFVSGVGRKQPENTIPTNTNEPVVSDQAVNVGPIVSVPKAIDSSSLGSATTLTPDQEKQSEVINEAKAFTERFGTYSNTDGYRQFSVLMSVMTTSMQTWTKTYVDGLKKQHPTGVYGMTTKALSAQVDVLEEQKATVTVETQRTEQIDTTTTSFRQKAKVELKKQNGKWLVDGIFFDANKTSI